MSDGLVNPLEGRAVIDRTNIPQRLAPDGVTGWALLAAPSSNTGTIYLGGAPDRYLHGESGTERTTGPQSTIPKGFPLKAAREFKFPVRAENVWIAGTINDVVLFVVLNCYEDAR